MPLYDIRCATCERIFETLLRMHDHGADIACVYCGAPTPAKPMLTGGRVRLASVSAWQPGSAAERLTGAPAAGPGTSPRAARSSILHACKGGACSLCGIP